MSMRAISNSVVIASLALTNLACDNAYLSRAVIGVDSLKLSSQPAPEYVGKRRAPAAAPQPIRGPWSFLSSWLSGSRDGLPAAEAEEYEYENHYPVPSAQLAGGPSSSRSSKRRTAAAAAAQPADWGQRYQEARGHSVFEASGLAHAAPVAEGLVFSARAPKRAAPARKAEQSVGSGLFAAPRVGPEYQFDTHIQEIAALRSNWENMNFGWQPEGQTESKNISLVDVEDAILFAGGHDIDSAVKYLSMFRKLCDRNGLGYSYQQVHEVMHAIAEHPIYGRTNVSRNTFTEYVIEMLQDYVLSA